MSHQEANRLCSLLRAAQEDLQDTEAQEPPVDAPLTTKKGQMAANPQMTSEQAQLAAIRERNRLNSQKARARSRQLVQQLTETCDALTKKLERLEQDNQNLKQQLEGSTSNSDTSGSYERNMSSDDGSDGSENGREERKPKAQSAAPVVTTDSSSNDKKRGASSESSGDDRLVKRRHLDSSNSDSSDQSKLDSRQVLEQLMTLSPDEKKRIAALLMDQVKEESKYAPNEAPSKLAQGMPVQQPASPSAQQQQFLQIQALLQQGNVTNQPQPQAGALNQQQQQHFLQQFLQQLQQQLNPQLTLHNLTAQNLVALQQQEATTMQQLGHLSPALMHELQQVLQQIQQQQQPTLPLPPVQQKQPVFVDPIQQLLYQQRQ